jgi:hyperosmotically inducible protein
MRYFSVLLLGVSAVLTLACRTNESPERQVDDAQITAQVKSKLASDIGLSTITNISVNTTNGVVTLSGQVNTADAKTRAEATAKSVPNVVKVVNNTQVASASSRLVSPRATACGPVLDSYCTTLPKRT